MRKIGLFYVSLFACIIIFVGCGRKKFHEYYQEDLSTAPYVVQSYFSMPGIGLNFDVRGDGRSEVLFFKKKFTSSWPTL